MTDTPDSTEIVEVTRNDDAGRYEIHVGGVLAGFTQFEPHPHGLLFTHTETDPAFSGRGLATQLIADTLADVASREETIVPECPFVVGYLREHEPSGLSVDWSRVEGV